MIFIIFVSEHKRALLFTGVVILNVSVLFYLEYNYPHLFESYSNKPFRILDVYIGTYFNLALAFFYAYFIKQAYKEKIKKSQESEELKTAFLQNISHEIRTPMNAIMGFSSLLQKQNLSVMNKAKYIETINSSGQHLISIIDDIVKISMLETEQVEITLQPVKISELLEYIYEQANMSPYMGKNVILRSPKNELYEDYIIETDKVKLTQILQNLITNALKYTPMGSVELGCVERGDFIEFYVADTGIGLEKKNMQVVFERFRQIEKTKHSKYQGSGLGLSITKSYVELLGGKIWVQSQLGKGSTFYFTIPFKEITAQPKVKESKKKTILVAEDDELNYNFIKILLEKKHTLIRATNGQEAVDIVESGQHVDCILMDIRMPILNGIEAAKLIKKTHPDMYIIAQTAYTEIENKEYFSKTDFDDYILKPINPKALDELLSFIIET